MKISNVGLTISTKLSTCVLVAALGFISDATMAAPDEIQVYIDDLTKPGRFGLDVHNNFVMSGSETPEFPGAQPPHHVYRLTPEFYYGANDTMEFGLYLLTTTVPGNPIHYDGEKLRFKFIAPHDETRGSFWGMNLEIGRTSPRVSQAAWNTELKGIYGYRSSRWLFAINPNLDWSLSGPVASPVSLEIDTKLAYRTHAGFDVGLESYNELGPVHNPGHLNQLSQTLYAVIDTQLGKFDLNAGVGRGLTPASDRWILKFIVGVHY